jgi:hypothetical protein
MNDLLFSYHLLALDSGQEIFEVLQDKGGLDGSNYSTTRWLWVYPVSDAWDQSILVGENDTLTFALRFELQARYVGFNEHILADVKLLPQHVWEGRGRVCRTSVAGSCVTWQEDIHGDFGLALDPVSGNGVAVSEPEAFQFIEAESWLLEDDFVIGTGPFEFDEWTPGVTVTLVKYEDFYADALDRGGGSYLHPPYIDEMAFKIYKTAQAAVFALQAREIDIISWPVPPEFVSHLLADPALELSVSTGQQFAYLRYDMKRSPFGYPDNEPSQGDYGLYLRKAVAHLIDKKQIVTKLLHNFGVAGDQPVSPASVKWYNNSVTKYNYDLEAARQLLDDHYTLSFLGGPGLGWSGGYRNLPGSPGTSQIEILCPQADHDPIRGQACNMMAADMREVGIHAYLRPSSILDPFIFRYEAWIVEETRPSDLVEYYYATFRSGGGRNLLGFQNETFDRLVREARGESDENRRIGLMKQCSGILVDALPADFMYFRTNTEAYRADKFVNWTLGRAGSIIRESFWSLVGVHPPLPTLFGLSVSSASAMKSEGTDNVVATVRDLSGVGMPGVTVKICVDVLIPGISPGNLTLADERGVCISGETDINGNLGMGYEAPFIDNGTIVVYFTATSAVQDFGEASAKSQTTVYSASAEFLSIGIEMMNGDILFAGGFIPVRIEVTDSQGLAVEGTAVTVGSSPEGLIFSPNNETVLQNGVATIWIQAPMEILDEMDELDFAVIVTATAEGYGAFDARKEITVLRYEPLPTDSDGAHTWRLTLVLILLASIGFALVLSALRRQSNGKS